MAQSHPRYGLDRFDHQSGENAQLPLRCMFCCTEKRLQTFDEIREGDHIKQQGERFAGNFGKKLVRFYYHHAIVKEIHQVNENGTSAIVTLIEFTSSTFDPTAKIREHTVVKNLHYDDIYLIKYRHRTHSPQDIISRGQKLMKEDLSYNLLFRNCEHVARWCVCGNDTSFQAKGFLEEFNMFKRFFNNYYLRISAMTVDDLLVIGRIPVLGSIVLVVIVLQQLLSSRTDTKVLNKLLRSGGICESCCKRRKKEIWVKFAILFTLQTGGLVATSFISGFGVQCLFGILMSILTVQVMRFVPKILKNIFSPFVGRKVHIDSLHKIWAGDVISWKYHGFYTDGIVTGISILPKSCNMKADIKVVHYTVPGVFASGKVVEEIIKINLKRDTLKLHDYTGYDFNEPETVIDRARKRLGETKYGLTNRSAHFCHWAKLTDSGDHEINSDSNQNGKLTYLRPLEEESKDSELQPLITDHRRKHNFVFKRPFTSKEIAKEKARIRDDIQPAQLIQFTYNCLPHKAVCTAVRMGDHPSKVILDVVHYGTAETVCEETFTFDLNKVDIVIVKGHPISTFNKKDIIRRAKARVGERGYNVLWHRASHLAEEIIYKDMDTRICSYSDVKSGDCISYEYWKLPHDAVVVDVEPLSTKPNNEGHITVVHYALDRIFGTRYIKRERVFFNLSKQSVVVKSFPGKVVYPEEIVVQRAISRLGEKKFHIVGNISSDFVHWAKVVQTPCIVSITSIPTGDYCLGNGGSQFLLLPRIGKPYEKHFQKDWIKTWDELVPGIIVNKGAITGIVTEVHITDNKVKVIQNVTIDNAEVMHIGHVKEVTFKVDLRTDFLTVYRCDPRVSNKPSICVRKAKRLLGLRVPGMGEWGFCKDCVVTS